MDDVDDERFCEIRRHWIAPGRDVEAYVGALCHYTDKQLALGREIEPGRWIREGVVPRHGVGPGSLVKETLWERVRRDEFPKRPSRADVCFAFTTEEHVQNGKESTKDHVDRVYLMEPAPGVRVRPRSGVVQRPARVSLLRRRRGRGAALLAGGPPGRGHPGALAEDGGR
jgi:hypothetical protein